MKNNLCLRFFVRRLKHRSKKTRLKMCDELGVSLGHWLYQVC